MDALSKRRTRDPIPFALRLRSLGSFMLYSRKTYTLVTAGKFFLGHKGRVDL